MKPTAIEWFRYEALNFGTRNAEPAPYLPLLLEHAGRRHVWYGLVDSGSDLT